MKSKMISEKTFSPSRGRLRERIDAHAEAKGPVPEFVWVHVFVDDMDSRFGIPVSCELIY